MPDVAVDVIAIGSLARNKYWKESAPVRQEYATATLVRAGDVRLMVDPGWPPDVLRSALIYRVGLEPGAVTHVFLTHLDTAHLMGIGLFGDAKWLAYEEEIRYAEAEWTPEEPARKILARLEAAPEKFAPGVDLYPTFGHTAGHASILVYSAVQSLIIAGDAVLTRDHFEHGDLGDTPWDIEKAKVSLQDIIEIADCVVPGHDNLFVCRGEAAL